MGKSRERLLHSAHAHAMNSGQFLLGGQLVALAQRAQFYAGDDCVRNLRKLRHLLLKDCARTD